ncbi:MAG: hypothetical protein HYZ58_12160, partial [Acidobacteria bacterium]|nr:hypothetical protein [Acidobacteriota bacterium]
MDYVNANGEAISVIVAVAVLAAGILYLALRYWLARRRSVTYNRTDS